MPYDTQLGVLSESYFMNTNMTGVSWFPRIFASIHFGRIKVALAIEVLNGMCLIIGVTFLTLYVLVALNSAIISAIYIIHDIISKSY